jgi:nucleoside-diphosphate-sugar epimerase
MDYHRQQKVDTRIVRIFNTYGPHMCVDDGRVMSNFICQGLRSEPLNFGDGGGHFASTIRHLIQTDNLWIGRLIGRYR